MSRQLYETTEDRGKQSKHKQGISRLRKGSRQQSERQTEQETVNERKDRREKISEQDSETTQTRQLDLHCNETRQPDKALSTPLNAVVLVASHHQNKHRGHKPLATNHTTFIRINSLTSKLITWP